MFKSEMGTMKAKKKKEPDKNIGEELLESKHETLTEVALRSHRHTAYTAVMPLAS